MGTNHTQADHGKRQCTKRSQWRVPPGKAPERLSPYYQLGCDFGSSLIANWSTDGCEPIYLCEEHVKQLAAIAPAARVRSVGQYEDVDAADGVGPVAEPPKPVSPPPATNYQRALQAQPAPANADALRKPTAPAPEQSLVEQCAAIENQMSELSSQLEGILSKSESTIDVAGAIDAPLEQVILEIIDNPAMSDAQKDAAITRLGEIQRSLKQVACNEMTLLEAHRLKLSLAGCLSSEIGLPEENKAAYRTVLDSIEKAIRAALCRTNSLVDS